MGTEIVQDEVVDTETGEVIEEPEMPETSKAVAVREERTNGRAGGLMSMEQVAQLVSPEGLEHQRKVMAAYDTAVNALVGENDIQDIGNKSFKKKSAWKKLGRVFHIDTEIIEVSGAWEWDPEEEVYHYNARARVRGIAPWGQRAEEYGGCSTRETRFYMSYPSCPKCGGPMWDNREKDWGGHFGCKDKGCGTTLGEGDYDPSRLGEHVPNPTLRAKAMHDCEATAVTRASNRATSALIAAGEVSAEEVEAGQSVRRSASSEVQGGNEGPTEPKKEEAPKATASQVMLISRMSESHVITDDERDKFASAIANGMKRTRASEAIEWLKQEIPARKELEKEEAGEGYQDTDRPAITEAVESEVEE